MKTLSQAKNHLNYRNVIPERKTFFTRLTKLAVLLTPSYNSGECLTRFSTPSQASCKTLTWTKIDCLSKLSVTTITQKWKCNSLFLSSSWTYLWNLIFMIPIARKDLSINRRMSWSHFKFSYAVQIWITRLVIKHFRVSLLSKATVGRKIAQKMIPICQTLTTLITNWLFVKTWLTQKNEFSKFMKI